MGRLAAADNDEPMQTFIKPWQEGVSILDTARALVLRGYDLLMDKPARFAFGPVAASWTTGLAVPC
jgi:hypothetical protein